MTLIEIHPVPLVFSLAMHQFHAQRTVQVWHTVSVQLWAKKSNTSQQLFSFYRFCTVFSKRQFKEFSRTIQGLKYKHPKWNPIQWLVHLQCICEYTGTPKYWKWDATQYITRLLVHFSLIFFIFLSIIFFTAYCCEWSNSINLWISRSVINLQGKIVYFKEF